MLHTTDQPIIAMMQKNEATRLEPWILYHGNLVGFHRLYIFDNGSNSESVLDTLKKYQTLGVNVDYSFQSQDDFHKKGEILSCKFKELEKENASLFIPLDCDEFISIRQDDGSLSIDRLEITSYLSSLVGSDEILVARDAHANVLGHPGYFFPAYAHHKVLFANGVCDRMDEGFHVAHSRKAQCERLTNLVYLHFHHRPFNDMVRQAKMKLKAVVDLDDQSALKNYQGPGSHAANVLLKLEEEYLERFQSLGKIYFPEIMILLRYLGVNNDFFDTI